MAKKRACKFIIPHPMTEVGGEREMEVNWKAVVGAMSIPQRVQFMLKYMRLHLAKYGGKSISRKNAERKRKAREKKRGGQ